VATVAGIGGARATRIAAAPADGRRGDARSRPAAPPPEGPVTRPAEPGSRIRPAGGRCFGENSPRSGCRSAAAVQDDVDPGPQRSTGGPSAGRAHHHHGPELLTCSRRSGCRSTAGGSCCRPAARQPGGSDRGSQRSTGGPPAGRAHHHHGPERHDVAAVQDLVLGSAAAGGGVSPRSGCRSTAGGSCCRPAARQPGGSDRGPQRSAAVHLQAVTTVPSVTTRRPFRATATDRRAGRHCPRGATRRTEGQIWQRDQRNRRRDGLAVLDLCVV
jgi:hypothetical protein